MGLFKSVKGMIGGVTGAGAEKAAKRAGQQQASAIMAGLRAQQAQIPAALSDLQRGVRVGKQYLRPFAQTGQQAFEQLYAGAMGTPQAYVPPTAEEVAASPAVRFRMQEAQRAAETGAAARGGLFGGAHQRELARYMQGLASQEYDVEAQRRLQAAQFAEEQRAQRARELMGLTGIGFGAAGELAGQQERLGAGMAGIRTGSGAAQAAALQSAGQARASGALAGAQARQQAMGRLTQLGGTLAGMAMFGPAGGAAGGSLFGGGGGAAMSGLGGGGMPAGGLGYAPSALNLQSF